MSRLALPLAVIGIVVAVGCSGWGWWHAHAEYNRLEHALAQVRTSASDTARLEAENVRLAELLKTDKRDQQRAAAALHRDVLRVRQDVDTLERKALAERDAMRARGRREIETLQANHDLAAGPMLIENCANVGRASPEAAVQTLIWAAAHGHDDVVRETIRFNAAARALAETAIAGLPESSRAQYPNPESLGALFVAQVVNDLSAVRVADANVNGNEATLTLAGLHKPLGNVTLQQAPEGWKVVIDPAGFDRIRRLLLTPRG